MSESGRGAGLGAGAYLLWGLFPLYWPLLDPSSSVEVLAHRVVWSLVVVTVLLAATRGLAVLRQMRGERTRLTRLSLAAVVIALNWGIYIYGVTHEHVVETSLGYFMNPIVTVMLGVFVLGERLRRAQWVAVAAAAVAVTVLAVQNGKPPWIALALAFSFATYGLLKKTAGAGAIEGLVVETAVLAPLALGYLAWLQAGHGGTFGTEGVGHAALLVLTGPITALPLLLFAAAASRVPLSTLGLLQYIAPTMQFLLGVLVFHEPLPALRLAGFVLVWLALAVFTADLIRHRRSQRCVVPAPV
ncbi:MAG TPA: EamA family transporter RarD [Mycobacteriales bacterium]|nr:EamA family transporter RarD [Mycobacteriales bacterium]